MFLNTADLRVVSIQLPYSLVTVYRFTSSLRSISRRRESAAVAGNLVVHPIGNSVVPTWGEIIIA